MQMNFYIVLCLRALKAIKTKANGVTNSGRHIELTLDVFVVVVAVFFLFSFSSVPSSVAKHRDYI